jgi:hypothetical protein
MVWVTVGGFAVLIVVLILAITFNVRLDLTAARLAMVSALFLALALVFGNVVHVVDDPEVIVAMSVIGSIAAGLAWFFILVGLIRFASMPDGR